jgi:hypothetical protein
MRTKIAVFAFILALAFIGESHADEIDWAKVDAALGKTASVQGEVHRYGIPRSDLQVTLDGVTIKPALALGGWLAFEPMTDGAVVMGDLKTIGVKGKVNGGVYQFSVPRKDPITENGMPVPPAMGTAIVMNFQPTGGGKAAITGDFVVTAEEVNPLIRTLRENGIEVTAIHSHMLDEQPRLFFVHFWANDDAVKLAKGLQAALEKIAVVRN